MPAKPNTIDEYLATVSADKRAALAKLRMTIKSLLPTAEEGFSYGLPAFILDGKPIAAFSASANHCSYFPMSGSIVAALADDLVGYETSKGGIRFPANKPLPKPLVKKLLQARMAEAGVGKQTDPAVEAFLKELDHPLKREIAAVRKIILGLDRSIREGIKWNAPSFRTTDYFATINLRSRDSVQLVFHTGAKVKASAKTGLKIADPGGLLKWLAKDRALVTLGSGKELRARRTAFEALVRDWIAKL